MTTLADMVRLPPDTELVDDAAQVAAERQLARIRAMPVGELVALTKGAIHETLEDILWELAEDWADAERAADFDDLAASLEEARRE